MLSLTQSDYFKKRKFFYITRNGVVGLGHQYVTALLSPPMEPKPRIYHPESKPGFQALKAKMESEWIPQLQKQLDLETDSLLFIWDADFLYGDEEGTLCILRNQCQLHVSISGLCFAKAGQINSGKP